MKFSTSDGVDIYYEHHEGEKETLVFIHGWLNNHSVWNDEASHFRERGYSTLALDLRGHGTSGTPEDLEAYTMARFAQDVQELLAHTGVHEPTLIGHSLGGMIALTYLKHHDHARRLVLIDTTYENPAKHTRIGKNLPWSPLTQRLIDFIKDKPRIQRQIADIDFSADKSGMPSWLLGAKHSAPHVILACMREILSLDEEGLLEHIDIPTLLIVGDKDTKTPAGITKKMHERIKDSTLVIIEQGEHDTPLTHPKRINQAIQEFLE